MDKTEYRAVHDGKIEWLQFKQVKTYNLFLFKWVVEKWQYVPSDYWDYIEEHWYEWECTFIDADMARRKRPHLFVTSLSHNIDWFVADYDRIDKWFMHVCSAKVEGWRNYEAEQKATAHQQKKLKGQVRYF